MLYEKLTADDIDAIDAMRAIGSEDYEHATTHAWVDTKTFLRYWEAAKGEYLYKIFGDKLILNKPIEVAIADTELYERMSVLIYSGSVEQLIMNIIDMLDKYQNIYQYCSLSSYSNIYRNIRFNCGSTDAFIANRYEGETMELKMPDGSTFKLAHGAKLMKALGKLAKFAKQTELFEEIRLKQSRIMNEARLKTKLCLSIHPLDYMTASYNANNWHSCMHWEDGEYRRGVIEMMNSPFVVVAYTASAHETLDLWSSSKRENKEWNSKKWREFFIVDPRSGIFAIKGYPYWNREIEDIALKWLAELCTPIFNDELFTTITHWETDKIITLPDGNRFRYMSMTCGPAMYNDFYSDNEYHAIFSRQITKNLDRDAFSIHYSGKSECICCGATNYEEDFDADSDLLCNNCVPHENCAICGDRLYDDDYGIQMNGYWYCLSCYDNLPVCDICGTPFDNSNDSEAGITFVVCDDEEKTDNSNVITDQYDHIERRCVCRDCAKDVFVDGTDELARPHTFHKSSMWNYYEQIPYRRIKHSGLELLYDPEIVKDFEFEYILSEAS